MRKPITIILILLLLLISMPIAPAQAATYYIDQQITDDDDDCEVYQTGSGGIFKLNGVGTSTGYYSDTIYKLQTGMRFRSIALPQGATITAAHLTLTCQASTSGTKVYAVIEGEDTNDANRFSDYDNFEDRNRTTRQVTWDNISPWNTDNNYQSPDIRRIIQEIVDRSGWRSGNDMVIFWGDPDNESDHGAGCYRAQWTYEGAPSKSARLHIEYTGSSQYDPAEDLSDQIRDLDTQIDNLSNQVSELSNTVGLQSYALELENLDDSLMSLKDIVESRLGAVESSLIALDTNIKALEDKESQLEKYLTELEKRPTITFLDWTSLTILVVLTGLVLSLIRRRTTNRPK